MQYLSCYQKEMSACFPTATLLFSTHVARVTGGTPSDEMRMCQYPFFYRREVERLACE